MKAESGHLFAWDWVKSDRRLASLLARAYRGTPGCASLLRRTKL